MRFTPVDPPRTFRVGKNGAIELKDCGRLQLHPEEQVTFLTEAGAEYDVLRKSWGFYATPSLNARLPKFGLRPVLARGPDQTFFVMLVEQGKEPEFQRYVKEHGLQVIRWLDRVEELQALAQDVP